METQQPTQPIGDVASPDEDVVVPDPGQDTPAEQPTPARPPTVGQLRRERKRLWNDRQEALYHIGGLALELDERGRLEDPLVTRRVQVVSGMDARLAEIDATLGEIDARRRRGRARTPDPTGYCMSCGAPHLADAAFCSRCGSRIHVPVDDDGDTSIIEMDRHE